MRSRAGSRGAKSLRVETTLEVHSKLKFETFNPNLFYTAILLYLENH